MTGQFSKAGDGMEVGTTGEGTSKKPSGKDRSSNNANNSA
jgi:hypothetical protein